MSLAENLQYLRAREGVTQEQLAERLDVSRQSVSKWESAASYPEMDTLLKLCDMFQVDMDTLLRGSVEKSLSEASPPSSAAWPCGASCPPWACPKCWARRCCCWS